MVLLSTVIQSHLDFITWPHGPHFTNGVANLGHRISVIPVIRKSRLVSNAKLKHERVICIIYCRMKNRQYNLQSFFFLKPSSLFFFFSVYAHKVPSMIYCLRFCFSQVTVASNKHFKYRSYTSFQCERLKNLIRAF